MKWEKGMVKQNDDSKEHLICKIVFKQIIFSIGKIWQWCLMLRGLEAVILHTPPLVHDDDNDGDGDDIDATVRLQYCMLRLPLCRLLGN